MAKIPTKLVKGTKFQVDVKPDSLNYVQREDIGRTYFHLKFAEFSRLIIFFCSIGALLALLAAAALVSAWIIIPAAIMFWAMLQIHDWYMEAWSRAGKYNRKTVVRVDVATDRGGAEPDTMWAGRGYHLGRVRAAPKDFNFGE
jgi:hypothetical protein